MPKGASSGAVILDKQNMNPIFRQVIMNNFHILQSFVIVFNP